MLVVFYSYTRKNIRQTGIPDYLIPVFANSVHTTIGNEAYEKIAKKIDRLLKFGEKKGYDYDQILVSILEKNYRN